MHFGQHLLEQRKKIKLSAEELAIRAELSRSYITLMENGKRLPSKKIFLKLANSLNVKVNIVINWYLEDLRKKLEAETAK